MRTASSPSSTIKTIVIFAALFSGFSGHANDLYRFLQSGHEIPSVTAKHAAGAIYDEKGQKIFDVLSLGKYLGEGGTAKVQEAVLRAPDGKLVKVAIKTFKEAAGLVSDKSLTENHLLEAFRRDEEHALHFEKSDLRFVNAKGTSEWIVLGSLTDGSLDQGQLTLKTGPRFLSREARLEEKIILLEKMMDQGMRGIRTLKRSGLSHGDIKPENIFLRTARDFDWRHPDPKKIDFQLADLDLVTKIGGRTSGASPTYMSPEAIVEAMRAGGPGQPMRLSHRAAAAYDVYSLATTVYAVAFGEFPFDAYLREHGQEVARLNPHDYPRKVLLQNHELYKKYMAWLSSKLQLTLGKRVSPRAAEAARKLEAFILSGLAYEEYEREGFLEAYFDPEASWVSKLRPQDDSCREAFSRI